MNRAPTILLILAALVGVAPATGHANSDPSTALRAGTISVPSVDEEPNNASTVGVNQGRASYRLDVVAPPGSPGVEPDLAISYGGGRQEGVVGAGWDLSVPSITVRTSGRGGQPRWGSTVRYLGTSGEELVELANTLADQDGDLVREAVFREERDTTYQRYVQLSGGGWRIDYPDGRKLTLGTSAATQVARAGYASHIVRWLPESLVDPSGNELLYVWSDGAAVAADIGSVSYNLVARYLTEMRWACQSCAGATTYQQLTLTYQDRVNHVTDFSAGYLVETEFQVATIDTATVLAGVPDPIRSYALSYDLSETRVLLESVTVTGADGTTLPPVSVRYTERDAPGTPSAPASPPGLNFQSGVQAIDVDLDGRIDVADLGNVGSGGSYHRNEGDSAAAFGGNTVIADLPGASLTAGGNVSAEDATRDVAMDVFDLNTGTLFAHDGAAGWGAGTAAALPPGIASPDSVRIDINQDGYVDLVDTSVDPWFVHLDDGSRTFTDDSFALTPEGTPSFGSSLQASADGVLFGDLNGDGLVDVLLLDGAGTSAYFFPGRGVMGFGWLPEDGRALSYTTLSIATTSSGPSIAETALMDVDGDGFGDLVSFDSASSRLRVFLRLPGNGFDDAGTGAPFVQSISPNDGCRTADWDQDGVSEILCSAGWQLYDFANQTPYLLEEIDNGLGQVTRLAYTTSARVAAAHEGAGAPWASNVAMALPVVQSTELDDSRGNVLVTIYDYRDASYEADELEDRFEFMGFGYVEATRTAYLETTVGDPLTRIEDPQDPGDRIRRFYDVGAADYFQRGMLDCVETWERAAVPTDFACAVLASGPLERVVSTHSSATDADGITTVTVDAEDRYVLEGGLVSAGVRLRTEYGYDAYGNRTSELRFGEYSGRADSTGDDQAMELTDFVRNTDEWLLRRPRLVQRGGMLFGRRGPQIQLLEETCYVYDGVTRICDGLYAGAYDRLVDVGLRTDTLRYVDADPTDGVAGARVSVEHVSYTAKGLPELITNMDGLRELQYDADFGLFKTVDTIDPFGLALTTTYGVSPKHGRVTAVTQPDTSATQATYDDLARLTSLVRMGDSLAVPTMTRSYLMAAPTSMITETRIDGTADGLITEHWLDGAGRLLCQRQEGAGRPDIETQREYTARGLTALQYLPVKAAGCDAVQRTVTGRGTGRRHDAYVYDALSRPVSQTHEPSGTSSSLSYGVLTVTESDEEDTDPTSPHFATPTERASDGLGRTVLVVENGDGDGDGVAEPHEMQYGYDALGRLTVVTDLLGATVFEAGYDARGRRVWASDSDRGVEYATYDDLDRPFVGTDARGHTTTHGYDAAGRLLTVATDDLASVETTTYHYDAHVNPADTAGCHVTGRLGWVTDASGQTQFCYDERGRVVAEDVIIDAYSPTPLSTQRTFDAMDRVETLTHPDGTVLTYGYDVGGNANHLTVESAGASYTLVSGALYTAAGQLRRVKYGNGAVINIGYDNRLRPRRHHARLNGVTELDLTASLDNVGNVESVADAVGHRSASFAYDDWNRLVEASGDFVAGETLTYGYDLRGNLTSRSSTDPASPLHVEELRYQHATSLHALTEVDRDGDGIDDELFAYDASGNVLEDGRFGFTFGAGGMLRGVDDVTTGAAIVNHGYDYQQRRVVSSYAGGDAVYFVRAANAEIREFGGGSTMRKHIEFASRVIGVVEDTFVAGTEADHIFLHAFDHLGGAVLVFDVAAAPSVVERWASYPFGGENTEPMAAAGTLADYRDPSDTTSHLSRRFQGREIDAAVPDFYDLGARVYRSDYGRFLSADTVVPDPGASQSWNRYAFVRNNPLRYTDPSGHAENDISVPVRQDMRPPNVEGSNAGQTDPASTESLPDYVAPSSPSHAVNYPTDHSNDAIWFEGVEPSITYSNSLGSYTLTPDGESWSANVGPGSLNGGSSSGPSYTVKAGQFKFGVDQQGAFVSAGGSRLGCTGGGLCTVTNNGSFGPITPISTGGADVSGSLFQIEFGDSKLKVSGTLQIRSNPSIVVDRMMEMTGLDAIVDPLNNALGGY